jgi:leucyl aminopeptidase
MYEFLDIVRLLKHNGMFTAREVCIWYTTSMELKLVKHSKPARNIIVAVFEGEKLPEYIESHYSVEDVRLMASFIKKKSKVTVDASSALFLPSGNTAIVLGKGPRDSWNTRKARVLVRRGVMEMKRAGLEEATMLSESVLGPGNLTEELELIGTEAIMADFSFNEYKSTPADGWPTIKTLAIAVEVTPSEYKELEGALEKGIIVGEETNHTRHLANTPGGDMTPAKLADEARRAARLTGMKVVIFQEPQIKRLGMGGVLGVSRGSNERPRFIILEHKGKGAKGKPLVLVGKGVTFDTGGLNTKPGESMYEMHMDMSGGAAVIHGMAAIARLKLPIHAIGLVPAVENMPSGSSYHPGDVLRSITGRTIEVLNTDAEGRVILADALGYAARYNPRFVVDIATLTGAAMVALGTRVNALFTDDENYERLLRDLGEKSGDYMWPLPMWEEYADEVRGTFGDVANTGKTRYGGAISGAMFLKEFVSYPWAHIDMAPTMTTNESDRLAKGAKGTGVRFFVELARYMAEHPQE